MPFFLFSLFFSLLISVLVSSPSVYFTFLIHSFLLHFSVAAPPVFSFVLPICFVFQFLFFLFCFGHFLSFPFCFPAPPVIFLLLIVYILHFFLFILHFFFFGVHVYSLSFLFLPYPLRALLFFLPLPFFFLHISLLPPCVLSPSSCIFSLLSFLSSPSLYPLLKSLSFSVHSLIDVLPAFFHRLFSFSSYCYS